ncbi:MAG: hypothetical protein JJT88_19155 [Gammaproteobacteria bacterium]|nr:hypothetical protein [Gammaproteobacteria bacterium]
MERLNGAQVRVMVLAAIVSCLTACGGGGSSTGSPTTSTDATGGAPAHGGGDAPGPVADDEASAVGMVQGVVIDGPVSEASVVFIDATGAEVARTVTDSDARFSTLIPDAAVYPLVMSATGGRNLTTNSAPDFALRGVVGSREHGQVVVSALSTLVMARAECGDSVSRAEGLQLLVDDPHAAVSFLASHGFGLTPEQRARLLGSRPRTTKEAAALLLASEALAESLRRASAALSNAGSPITADELLSTVACDLGQSLTSGAENAEHMQRLAAFHTAAAAVRFEAGLGRLKIAGIDQDVAGILEQAVVDTFGFDHPAALDSLAIGADFLDVLRNNVYALLASTPTVPFFDLYADLLATDPDTPRGEMRIRVANSGGLKPLFQGLLLTVSSEEAIARSVVALANAPLASSPPPQIEFSASPENLASRGGSTAVAYAAEHATVCLRLGADAGVWSGISGPEAQLKSDPIAGFTTLALSCAGPGGLAETSVHVTVPPAAQIKISAASAESTDFVALGDEVRVEFEVADAAPEDCSLVRSDSGAVMASGDTLLAAPEIELLLTCKGPGGMATTVLPVPVRAARLHWVAPSTTENDELLNLEDLVGYRIYQGSSPGRYDQGVISISDPQKTEYVGSFPPGRRYFAMTAVSKQGVESRLSNEVIRDIP